MTLYKKKVKDVLVYFDILLWGWSNTIKVHIWCYNGLSCYRRPFSKSYIFFDWLNWKQIYGCFLIKGQILIQHFFFFLNLNSAKTNSFHCLQSIHMKNKYTCTVNWMKMYHENESLKIAVFPSIVRKQKWFWYYTTDRSR